VDEIFVCVDFSGQKIPQGNQILDPEAFISDLESFQTKITVTKNFHITVVINGHLKIPDVHTFECGDLNGLIDFGAQPDCREWSLHLTSPCGVCDGRKIARSPRSSPRPSKEFWRSPPTKK
jgi:hypothetical protein